LKESRTRTAFNDKTVDKKLQFPESFLGQGDSARGGSVAPPNRLTADDADSADYSGESDSQRVHRPARQLFSFSGFQRFSFLTKRGRRAVIRYRLSVIGAAWSRTV